MARPFSELVAGEPWRLEAEIWIADQLARDGHRISGDVTQPRARPWSTQLVVPTDTGTMWFKANCAAMAFEPGLQAELARLIPDSVDAPYATAPHRGWMLTADHGATLGDSHEPTADDWCRVVTEAARAQRVLVDHRGELLATGLPNCSPDSVPERFDRLVETFSTLHDEHPSHLSLELVTLLIAKRPKIVDAVQLLAESVLPTTLQHGDLHPWNVYANDRGELRAFDFGDAQWAHAVETLSVPHDWMLSRSVDGWPRVVEAYCGVWDVEPGVLAEAWRATRLTQPVNRALTWWGALAEASAAESVEWAEGPVHHLTRVLDG